MIETTGLGAIIVISAMFLVTLSTRLGGVFVMSYIPISFRVKQFIQAMSGSVLVAILTPMAITGDNGARLALFSTAVVMLLVKKPLPAITVGVATAAIYRLLHAG